MDIKEIMVELSELGEILSRRIEVDSKSLSAKNRLIRDLGDIGFNKTLTNKFIYILKNRGKSYITFTVLLKGKTADVIEDHLVANNGEEVPISTIQQNFMLHSVRYSRVLNEIGKRIKELKKEVSRECIT